jgi:hypothetical protein
MSGNSIMAFDNKKLTKEQKEKLSMTFFNFI